VINPRMLRAFWKFYRMLPVLRVDVSRLAQEEGFGLQVYGKNAVSRRARAERVK
jgi:hypothetical protein